MGLAARLAKLEEKAAQVIRCAWCRVSLLDDHQQKARGRKVTTDYVMRSCPFCGNEFKVGLEGLTARERESVLLWAYTYKGETYRDARAYAAQEWWTCRAWVRLLTTPPAEARRRLVARNNPDKADKYAQERAALKAEADRLRKAEERRQRREYGPRTFPLVATLRGLKGELKEWQQPRYTPGYSSVTAAEKLAREVLIYARCMEACEMALWGAVEPDTAAVIEARSSEVAAFDAARTRAQQEKEREERERREEASRREHERQERAVAPREVRPLPPASLPPDAPRSRFRKIGAPVPHSPMVIDPTAAHVPDPADPSKMIVVSPGVPVWDADDPEAVQFQRSTSADPTRGLTIEDVEAASVRPQDSGRRYYRPETWNLGPYD